MEISKLSLKRTFLDQCVFYVNDGFKTKAKQLKSSDKVRIPLRPAVSVKKINNKENLFYVILKMKIGEKSDEVPFYIEIVMRSIAQIEKDLSEEEKKQDLTVRAPGVLLGYIRTIVSTLTAYSQYVKYDIPDIDFSKKSKNANKGK